MPTASKAAELRRRAKDVKIPNWQSMERAELEEALKSHEGNGQRSSRVAKTVEAVGREPRRRGAKRVSENKAIREGVKARKAAKTAKRKAADRREVIKKASAPKRQTTDGNVNPFRSGTQLNAITEELLKGGKRQSIINRLKRRFTIHSYANKPDSLSEEEVDFQWDKRLLMAREKLVELGWTYDADGRGREGTLQVYPPNGAQRPAAARKRSKTAPRTRKASKKR